MATIGDENYIRPCKALFICDTPLASTKGMDGLLSSNAKKAQELLKEAGYDGTPVVLMHSTDLKVLTNLAPVAKSLMEKAGFKVDMQSMDWQTLVARRAKKDPPERRRLECLPHGLGRRRRDEPDLDRLCERRHATRRRSAGPATRSSRSLRDDFARETDPAKQKAIAEAVQLRVIEYTPEIPVGEWVSADCDAQERQGVPDFAGAGALEHRNHQVM